MSAEAKMTKLVEKMKGGREDQMQEVITMRDSLKKALLKKNLREHPALLQLLSMLKKREGSYSLLLANKPFEAVEKRAEWFACRAECRFFISFFEVDKTIESIDKSLDYYLSDEVEGVDNP